VVIVGGGPAGAATAIGLAQRGRDVLLLERAPVWRWRACGVFTSPAAVVALRRLGLTDGDLTRVARRVPAMRVETPTGTRFRLTYGDDGSLTHAAVGLDRSALDPLLLDAARDAGAEIRAGVVVRRVRSAVVELADGSTIAARVVVGADGLRSVVARDAGVARRPPLGDRPALTFHVEEPGGADRARDARMIVFDGGYVGLAPVPGHRVNVGIVLASRAWRDRLRAGGAEAVASAVLSGVPPAADDPIDWARPRITDRIEGVAPVGARVRRRAGSDWLLVGDAAGFLDPFTGEGLHRALVSARLAAIAIERGLDGDPHALEAYARALTRRTRPKDVVSRVVQGFLAIPPAFEYAARRLEARAAVRETMGLVIGDLAPAGRALDPGSSPRYSGRDRPPSLMRSSISIDVAAPARLVFDLAKDIERWPRLLPHYLDVRVEDRDPGGAVTARMVALRPVVPRLGYGIPVAWRARMWPEPSELRLRFVHLGGATAGMDVTWHIEQATVGCRVTIEHDFEPGVPAWAHLLDAMFVRPIAGRTLATFKSIAEAVAEPSVAGTPPATSDRRPPAKDPS